MRRNTDDTTPPCVCVALLDLSRATVSAKAQWALIGGQALRSYGVPRDTLDADALVPREDIAGVSALLIGIFGWTPLVYDPETNDYVESPEVLVHEMQDPVLFDVHELREMIPLSTPLGLRVELLTAQHPIEEQMILCAASRKHCGVGVPVAPLGGVLLVKTKADRPKDIAAIEQTAEHLPHATLEAAIEWAKKRDPETASELRNIIEAARARLVPVRNPRRPNR